jgi:hypothetical protein
LAAPVLSEAPSIGCALLGPGVEVGVGPVLLRTWS